MNTSSPSHRGRTRSVMDRWMLRLRGLLRRLGAPPIVDRQSGHASHLPACYFVE